MEITIRPVFEVGQIVWSRVGEFRKGIVIDWSYNRRTRCIQYQVTFQSDVSSLWYFQDEISDIQIFE